MFNDLYPNDGGEILNPTHIPKERKELERESLNSIKKDAPILEWLDNWFDEQIKQTDSIDRLSIDLTKADTDLSAQLKSLQYLKRHLLVAKDSIHAQLSIYLNSKEEQSK